MPRGNGPLHVELDDRLTHAEPSLRRHQSDNLHRTIGERLGAGAGGGQAAYDGLTKEVRA